MCPYFSRDEYAVIARDIEEDIISTQELVCVRERGGGGRERER